MTKSLHKPLSLRWGQQVWNLLGLWSKQINWPLDTLAARILMLPLLPFYLQRLGFMQGLVTLYRFVMGQGGFTVYRSDMDPGLEIREDSTDALVFHQVFILRDYQKCSSRDNVHVIVDAGAYVGYSAIYFAELYPHAFIYALEPEESNFQALLRNTRNYPNILAIQAALWNNDGTLEIVEREAGQWSFTVQETQGLPNARRVPALSLKTLMDQYRIAGIDILKIDIEGSESTVFAQSSCHVWLPRVQALVIELHDHLFPGSEQNFVMAMSQYDFDVQFQGENLILDFHHKNPKDFAPEKVKRA